MSFSTIIAGTWRLPDWGRSADETARWIGQALDLGVDTFDLADIYGGYTVEQAFGDALRADPGLAPRLRLVTKCDIRLVNERRPENRSHIYDTSAEHIIRSVDTSLAALGVERLDLLLLHRQDPLLDPDEVAGAFASLRDAGKVAAFGMSNATPSHLAMLQSRLDEPLVTNQVEASLLHLAPFMDGTLDQAIERRFRPMAWSPLAGGRLFQGGTPEAERVRAAVDTIADARSTTADAVALAFLMRHPSRMHPVVGTGKIDRLESAVRAASLELTRDEWFDLWRAGTGAPLP